MMSIVLKVHTPPNRNMLPWNPNASFKDGKHVVTTKTKNQISVIQYDAPKSFKFSGITSEKTTNGKVMSPQAPASKANEKLAIGIQL